MLSNVFRSFTLRQKSAYFGSEQNWTRLYSTLGLKLSSSVETFGFTILLEVKEKDNRSNRFWSTKNSL